MEIDRIPVRNVGTSSTGSRPAALRVRQTEATTATDERHSRETTGADIPRSVIGTPLRADTYGVTERSANDPRWPGVGRLCAGAGALVLAALDAGWIVLVALTATPCGIDGQGILQSTGSCRVEVGHVLAAVFGFGGAGALAASTLLLMAYALSGSSRTRSFALRLMLLAGALAFVWILAGLG